MSRSSSAVRVVCTLAVAALIIGVASCSSDDEVADAVPASSPTTTAPIPRPGGMAVAEYDVCAEFDDVARSYLATLGAAEVDRATGDSSDIASVCGWFLVSEPGDDGSEERLLFRVEPVRSEGNFLCEQRAELSAESFEGSDAPDGWLAISSAPLEAASEDDTWCAYVRAPESIEPDGPEVRSATTAVLGAMHERLPR